MGLVNITYQSNLKKLCASQKFAAIAPSRRGVAHR
jgi:hypothetical protein